MTYEELEILIKNDEHRQLELKKTTGELKDGKHSACAFLNTEGGWLIFGVTPSSLKILGQEVTDNTQREIAQALSYLEPQVDVRVEYVDYSTSYIERWGSGVKRITDACAYRNVETPTWTTDGYFVTVTFKRPDYNANVPIDVPEDDTINDTKDDTKDSIKDCVKELSERQVDILSMIAEDCTITSQKIAQKMSQKMSQKESSIQRTVKRDLADLQAKGIIAREGGRKNGRWVILKPLE